MNTNDQNESTASADATTPAEAEPKTVPVLTRFERAELDAMKDETGATADDDAPQSQADATAVACFVRKNLRKRG